jgi:hypothetical protein
MDPVPSAGYAPVKQTTYIGVWIKLCAADVDPQLLQAALSANEG